MVRNNVLQTGYAAKVVVIALKHRLILKKSWMARMNHRVVRKAEPKFHSKLDIINFEA